MPRSAADGSGWNTDDGAGGRVFQFSNTAGSSTLVFDRNAVPVFDRQLNPHPYAFTDWLAYDAETDPQVAHPGGTWRASRCSNTVIVA